MKLLLQSLNFSPEPTGIGRYSGELAWTLAERGHDVVVVCAPAHYPQWRRQGRRWGWWLERPRPGLRVWRCPLWVPAKPNAWGRILHQISFALSSAPVLWAVALLWRPDGVFSVLPSMATAPAAWGAARLARARAWLHVQDLEVDAAFGMDLLHGDRLRRAVVAVEQRLLRAFDRVSTISRPMLGRLADKGVDLQRLSLLPNWVNLQQLRPDVDTAGLRLALGLQAQQRVVLFSGSMNRKQGLEVVVAAARLLADRPDIVVLLCGDGEVRPFLESAAQTLPQLRVLPLQPSERLPELLALADLHVLPQRANAADLVLPSKLAGMLASGRPVVATAAEGSEIELVVRGCGLCVAPADAAALANAIRQLLDDPATRAALGARGRRHAELHFDREAILDRFEADWSLLLACARPGSHRLSPPDQGP